MGGITFENQKTAVDPNKKYSSSFTGPHKYCSKSENLNSHETSAEGYRMYSSAGLIFEALKGAENQFLQYYPQIT